MTNTTFRIVPGRDGRQLSLYPAGNGPAIWTATGALAAQSATMAGSGTVTGGGGGPTWAPNLPAGLSVIVDRQWDPTDASIPGGVLPPASLTGTDSTGMAWNGGSPSVLPLIDTPANLTTTIGQTIPTLPDSHATCMAIKYTNNYPSGNNPFGVAVASPPLVKHMYIACWVCMPAGFNANSNNIKWVFFAQNGSNGRNHVVMLSSGASGSYVGPWVALQGGGGSFNVGGNNNTKTGWITNLTNANLPALQGTWACFEWEMTLETTPGVSADGVCKFWVNNSLRGSWANINYNAASGDPAGFDTVYFAPFYGGGGSNAPSIQYLCLGRFYAAGHA